MPNYRRTYVPGGCYFFTVALAERKGGLSLVAQVDQLRAAFRYAKSRRPFVVEAIVVLPDHLHTIWRLPEGDADFSVRWNLLKGTFSRSIPPGEHRSASRIAKRERGIWQRRCWEHVIRDELDLERHFDYVHFNAVKHGYVDNPFAWPHSSFRRFVEKGWYDRDWIVPDRVKELTLE
jgi:putative transposase